MKRIALVVASLGLFASAAQAQTTPAKPPIAAAVPAAAPAAAAAASSVKPHGCVASHGALPQNWAG